MTDDQTGTQGTEMDNGQDQGFQAEQTHETQPPAELLGVISELEDGPLDEDSVMDEDDNGDDESFVDADELFNVLAKIQTMLEDQAKEIRGLRREMRELREGQGSAQPQRSPRPPRVDRPREGGYQGRDDRGGSRGDRPSFGGDRGGQGGSDFRPRARADRGWSGGNRDK